MKLDVGAEADAPVALEQRVAALRAQVASVAQRVGRDAASVRIVAVTKGHSRAAAAAAIASGIGDIGENYVQEAVPKYDGLGGASKHFLGRVQTNKAKAIVETFDVVQTIDRVEAGLAILRASRERGRSVYGLIQVRIADDKRFGAEPDEAAAIAGELRAAGLPIHGVMAIGPFGSDEATVRRSFSIAAQTYERVGGSILSLGMSDDWHLAVACGSTMIRIGTALFGERV